MNDEMLEDVTRAILPAFAHIEDEDYRATIAGCWARAAIEAIEAVYDGNNQRLRMALTETREALGYTDASIGRCEAIIDAALS